ncbi:MAG: C40 family peptidase [Actinobacteria bacterium]|nr:C40 family peptidase [Actinomycetota bacterium]
MTVLEPSDSLLAAQAELDVLTAERQSLAAEDQSLAQTITLDDAQLAATQRERDALTARRQQRAALLYRDLADSVTLAQVVLNSSVNPENDDLRRLELATSADRGEQRTTRQVDRTLRAIKARLADEHRRRDDIATQLPGLDARLAEVMDKLTAATASVSVVGPQIAAPPGPDPIARAAAGAELALTTAQTAQQTAAIATYRAAAASGDPVLAQAAAATTATAATTQAAYVRARGTLARLVARVLHGDGAPLDFIWAATPTPALRAVLFGLSQVGKPYVYATAGPDTYDCSGLTKRAWAESGVGLPHFSGAQLHAGLPVAVGALRPGDLLTYGPDGSQHVVLYIGNGWVVQAEGRAYGVLVTPVNVDPLQGFAGASRPVP